MERMAKPAESALKKKNGFKIKKQYGFNMVAAQYPKLLVSQQKYIANGIRFQHGKARLDLEMLFDFCHAACNA